MALQRQTAEISLACGIETKLDSKLVPANRSLVAENISFVNAGSSSTRYGYTSLSTSTADGSTISDGIALSTPNTDLVLQDGLQYYVYGENAQVWIPYGPSVPCSLTTTPVVVNSYTQTAPVCAVAGNIMVFAWEDSRGGVRYSVRDTSDPNLFYQTDTSLSTTVASPQLLAIDLYVYLAVTESIGATHKITLYRLSAQTPASAFVAITNLTLDLLSSSGKYGIARYGTTNDLIFAFASASNAGELGIGTVNVNGVPVEAVDYTTTLASTFNTIALATTFEASPNMAVTFSGNTTPRAIYGQLDPLFYVELTPAGGGASNIVRSTVAFKDDGTSEFQAYYDDNGSTTRWPAIYGANYTGAVAGDTFTQYGLNLASHTVYCDGHYPVVCSTPTTVQVGATVMSAVTSNQTTFFTLREDGTVLNRFLVQTAGGAPTTFLANITNVDDVLYTAISQKTVLRANAEGSLYTATGVSGLALDFSDTSSCMAMSWDNEEFVNDGKAQIFDGGALVESGYNMYPELNLGTFTTANSGGSMPGSTLYTYYAVYEWIDYDGRWHRSAPSFPMQKTTASGGAGNAAIVSFFVPYLPFTQRSGTRGTVQIAIYRTVTDGDLPYRVHVLNAYPNLTDGTAGFTFTDTATDASIEGRDPLYSYASPTGVILSEVPNDPAPSFTFAVEGQGRIIGIPQDRPLTYWYTKPRVADRAPEFSGYLVGSVEATGGPLTAAGFLDDNIILFKEGRMYVVTGSGPNALGQPFDGYSAPRLLTSTDGCISPRSVVKTDQGLYFQGNRGILLLDRSLTVRYVGSPVEAYRADTVTGSVLVPAQNQVRFVTDNDVTLIYDYLLNQWSTYDYGGTSAAAWNLTTPVVMTSSGVVRQEVSEQVTDNGDGIGMTYRTAWLKPAQMAQGYARVWQMELIGNYLGEHVLYIDIFIDYETQPVATLTWTPADALNGSLYGSSSPYGSESVYGGTGSTVYQVRSRIPVQRCEAISFQFRTAANAGASCQLNNLALVLGVIGEVNRLPNNKTV